MFSLRVRSTNAIRRIENIKAKYTDLSTLFDMIRREFFSQAYNRNLFIRWKQHLGSYNKT